MDPSLSMYTTVNEENMFSRSHALMIMEQL